MLPFTCFLVDDSKSNSSSRLPLSTTTRVSSGWAASMSMRFAIRAELRGARLRPLQKRPAARCCGEESRGRARSWRRGIRSSASRRHTRPASGPYDLYRPALRPGAAARNLPVLRVCVATPPGDAPGWRISHRAIYRANPAITMISSEGRAPAAQKGRGRHRRDLAIGANLVLNQNGLGIATRLAHNGATARGIYRVTDCRG